MLPQATAAAAVAAASAAAASSAAINSPKSDSNLWWLIYVIKHMMKCIANAIVPNKNASNMGA